MLAGLAALRAGAGTLQIATARGIAPHVAVAVPEARVIALPQTTGGEVMRAPGPLLAKAASASDAIAVGPGMKDPRAAIMAVERSARSSASATLILDCVALEALRRRSSIFRHAGGIVATPHAGEMARLMKVTRAQVEKRALELARQAAHAFGAIVVLKGARTYIVAPDGLAFENTAGNPGLGTGGSGDTLSGVIAGLAARGATPLQASVWGVFLHATAGDRLAAKVGPVGFLARELLAELPRLLANRVLRGAAQ